MDIIVQKIILTVSKSMSIKGGDCHFFKWKQNELKGGDCHFIKWKLCELKKNVMLH
jgi:hypothetical protein